MLLAVPAANMLSIRRVCLLIGADFYGVSIDALVMVSDCRLCRQCYWLWLDEGSSEHELLAPPTHCFEWVVRRA